MVGWRTLGLIFLIGLGLGLALGLGVTWGLWPVQYYDTDPVDLKREHQNEYILLVSQAYAVDGDLTRARARLAYLKDSDIGQRVADLAELYIKNQGDLTARRSLARLADALGRRTPAMLVYLAAPTASPTASPSPVVTFSPTPSVTPWPTLQPTATPTVPPTVTPTPGLQFHLLEKRHLTCQEGEDRLLIYVRDAKGRGIPNVQLQVEGPEKVEVFYTGLKPDKDPGYADYTMSRGAHSYTVVVTDGPSEIATGLSAQPPAVECPGGKWQQGHAWLIVFERRE